MDYYYCYRNVYNIIDSHIDSVDHDGVWIVDHSDRLRRTGRAQEKEKPREINHVGGVRVLRLSFSVS